MMPNRIIKESVCTSDSIDKLNWFEEVLFYRLMVSCDDYGRFDGRVAVIKNRLFPLKEELTMDEVGNALEMLAKVDLVRKYSVEGKPYIYLPTWEHHQTIRAKRSKYPDPEGDVQASEIICMQMNADDHVIQSNPIQSESNPNTNIRVKRKRFTPPTVEEVREYCLERKNNVDAERFIDYYSSQNWKKANGRPLEDWKAAVRTWEKNNYSSPKAQKPVEIPVPDYMQRQIEDMKKRYG